MYNTPLINELISFIRSLDNVYDKAKVTSEVQKHFNLSKDRSVFFCKDFAIRFCRAGSKQFSNTVLALSNLRKYDDRPFIVCLVAPQVNYLMLANSSFLKKVSHSSHDLRVDKIRGSFNGPDIMKEIEDMDNSPENFEKLYSLHENFTFEENLIRLVDATNNIQPFGKKFMPDPVGIKNIQNSVERAADFLQSDEYNILNKELCHKVCAVESEIITAYKRIDNVNLRGRVIEYLITSENCNTRDKLISALRNNTDLPKIFTDDDLGDYKRNFDRFHTQTDIKSKILSCSSNPKGYNIDKLLQLLAMDSSVYLIYLVGIDGHQSVKTALYSVFDERLVSTTRLIKHWAGRNSRGVAQFDGNVLGDMIRNPKSKIDQKSAQEFIMSLL